MKKISILISIIITLGLLLATTACNAGFNEKIEVNNPQTEGQLGSATFNIVVPDYYALAGVARAIPPQATDIKLYYKKSNGEWNNNVVPIALSAATKTNMTGAPDGTTPPAAIYTCTFAGIPSGVYAAGFMKIEVLAVSGSGSNQSTTVLSSGTNENPVRIVMGETTTAAFFTIPVDTITVNDNSTSGSQAENNPVSTSYNLAAEEMRFLKKQFSATEVGKLNITVSGNNANYPDVVVFDDKGRFEKYIALSSSAHVIDCAEYADTTKYFGFWFAQKNPNAFTAEFTSYSLVITNSLFQNIMLDTSGWFIDETVSQSGSFAFMSALDYIDYNNPQSGLYFDYKEGLPQDTALRRQIAFPETKVFTFEVSTNLNIDKDGYLKFYVDDVLKDSYTGSSGFQLKSYEIPAGIHTIKWEKVDNNSESSATVVNGYEAYAKIKNFSFGIAPLSSINQTFETAIDENMWVGAGLSAGVVENDPVFAKWNQYGDALVDTHRKVYKLATHLSGNTVGNSSLTIQRITVTEPSAISFDFKSDLLKNDSEPEKNHYFRVYVDKEGDSSDDNADPVFEATGSVQVWQNKSVILPSAGTYSVKFTVIKSDYYGTSVTNDVYIDNITLAPNTTDSVGIYPKGVQETYVNGDTIQFTAKALRSDGTAIEGKTVTWATTRGSISSSGLFTPGSSSGNATVTATIDGVTAYNDTVVVHGANYLSDPVTLNGHTFTGAISSGSGTRSNTTNITLSDPTPNYSTFTADGFFVLKGHADGLYGYVKVTKTATTNPTYVTTYFLKPGDFEQRIWLRFGQGEYDVSVYEIPHAVFDTGCGEGYEGDYHRTGEYYTSGATTTKFTVTNSTPGFTHTAEECAYLMPSYICQSDDFVVSNAFNAVIAELPSNATLGQKLQALYDWELHRTYYDKVSLHDNQRKAQDAVHVIKYGMAVCEGYANLYAAFTRLLGLQTAYQTTPSGEGEMNHAWIECKYNNEWKLVDPTWDDPVPRGAGDEYNDRAPTAERYDYFFIAVTGVNADHYHNSTDYSRMVIPTSTVYEAPELTGVPNGWY